MPTLLQAKPQRWMPSAALVAPEWRWAWRGLVWAVAPGGRWKDELIAGSLGTLQPSGNWGGITEMGVALESISALSGGIDWPFPERLNSITTDLTIIVWAELDALTAWSRLYCSPYHASGAWSNPFDALSLHRHSSTSSARFEFATSPITRVLLVGGTNYIIVGEGMIAYGVTRQSGTVKWYKDGVFHSQNLAAGVNPIDWSGKGRPILFNRSGGANGEGIDGRCPLALVYNRTLNANEMAALYRDPWGPFRQQILHAAKPPVLIPVAPSVAIDLHLDSLPIVEVAHSGVLTQVLHSGKISIKKETKEAV